MKTSNFNLQKFFILQKMKTSYFNLKNLLAQNHEFWTFLKKIENVGLYLRPTGMEWRNEFRSYWSVGGGLILWAGTHVSGLRSSWTWLDFGFSIPDFLDAKAATPPRWALTPISSQAKLSSALAVMPGKTMLGWHLPWRSSSGWLHFWMD